MAYETLLFEKKDGLAHITLNRPEAANALNLQMGRELMQVAIACDEDPSVRAVLMDASGRMFCAGGDLASFADAGDAMGGLLKELTTYLHAGISRFARMRAPLVTAVGGAAAGAGFSMVCAADLVVCGESAKFTMAYTGAGLSPDGSSSYYLPRLIGARRTLELMLLNRRLSAAEALEWGIVNEVVADDALAERALALATQLAHGPTEAYATAKKLVLASATESLETQMELEARGIAAMTHTADAQEGIQAFFDKRKATFTGR
jgi:2-(1,2-epoxy-1,2-dihydrophenyl)acetyl-CoA isomerase